MSADLLRQAAECERLEWGDPDTRRAFPKASEIHLALADWLGYTAELLAIAEADHIVYERPFSFPLRIANLIVGTPQ